MEPRIGVGGHLWTLGPAARSLVLPPATSAHERFEVAVEDPQAGRFALTGRLHAPPGASRLVIALHGLGGSCDGSYARTFARAAAESGYACLRLNLRGADHEAPDFYHAGLTSDLDAVLAAKDLARFSSIYLVGFSVGGHVALRWAAERAPGGGGPAMDRRVGGLVAVCAPLDLDRGSAALDSRSNVIYRSFILSGLRTFADAVERLRPPAIAAPRAARQAIRTMREWDRALVAPRWGFSSAEDYYERASVAPLLSRLTLPTWIVVSENDPMVPPWTVRHALAGASSAVEVTWTPRGGHVGMPAGVDLGRRGRRGRDEQILGWIGERA